MNKRADLFLLIIISIFVFRSFLGVGVRVANDFPLVSQESLKTGFSLPQIWSRVGDNLGEYAVSTLWSWPLDFLYGLGATLGVNFSILERVFGVLLFLAVGIFSIRKLLSKLGFDKYGKFIASLFYLTNTFVLLLIDGGQFQIALAYAFFPLAFTLVLEGVKSGFRQKLVSGIAFCLLGFSDIRFVYVLGILLFFKFFYEIIFSERGKFFGNFLSWTKVGVAIIFVFFGLNFYWILPAFLVKAPALPETYQRVTQTSFLSFANLGHSLFLLQPHWYKNVFGKVTPLLPEFFLIPVLVFLAPVLRRKDKEVGFWLLVALVGIFLVKGNNPPLGWVYPWLFSNIPGFSLFRDPTKFFFLVSISYSVLLGISVDEISSRINKFTSFLHNYHATVRGSYDNENGWRSRLKYIFKYSGLVRLLGSIKIFPLGLARLDSGFIFCFILAVYFLILARPVWLGKMTGIFSPPINQKEFKVVRETLEKDSDFGRVFWMPARAPFGYSSPTHPVVEASRFYQKRPFATGVVGSYEFFNFLREAPFMGELFDIAGIKYLVYPYPDTRREELKPDNIDYYYAFLDQITNLPWIEGRLSEPPVALLKVKNSQDHLFLTKKTFLIVGSDGIYNDLVKTDGFRLAENALIFAEEKPGLGNICRKSFCEIILFGKEKTDFSATFIDKSSFIFPAQYLGFDPDPSASPDQAGWWKRETFDFLWMRNFLQQKYGIDNLDFDYGGGYAISEGNNSRFIIYNSKFQKGNILLARVMKSGSGGKIEFFQEDKKIGEIATRVEKPEKVVIKLTGYKDIPDRVTVFDKADFAWYEVGKLIDDQPLTIKAEGDINVVNSLAVVTQDEWSRISDIVHEYKIFYWNDLSDESKRVLFSLGNIKNTSQISYERISPTKYRFKISGLTSPSTVAFSDTYDSLWEIIDIKTGERRNSYPLYSLINGFYVQKDGVYDIYFSPQKYVLPAVLVAGISCLFSFFLLLRIKNKSKIKYNFWKWE